MPCETIDFKGFSSSSMFSSEDICSSNESQAKLWKLDKPFKSPDFDKVKPLEDSNEVDIFATQNEISLFSSSLPNLFSRKLRFSANNALYGHSSDEIASHEEEKLVDSLEELKAQIIETLLPDEDDLLSGVTDWNERNIEDNASDETYELDLFKSNGGLDLQGDDSSEILNQAHNSSTARENRIGAGLRGISSSLPNTLPSLIKVKSVGNQCEITESSSPGQLNLDTQATLAFHPHSVTERHRDFTRGVRRNPLEVAANINLKIHERMGFDECVSKSSGDISSSYPHPGHHNYRRNSYPPHGLMWPNSPPNFHGISAPPTLQRLNQIPMAPSHMITTVLPPNSHHVQSPPLWDRRYIYAAESITPHCVDIIPHNMFPPFEFQFHNQRDMTFPARNHMINSFDSYKCFRSRRNVGATNSADLKRFELDIGRIERGEDDRTTLMIKNIPNKYTSKMLLAAIDVDHKGTYDFVYLPIDFTNKCNVGYAFINMISPSSIIQFYKAFNEKKWEKFNSLKMASLAYARIQGRDALVDHFKDSSLMNEDKRCRPILIDTDGPNVGNQVPFPIGTNFGNKTGRVRGNIHD